MPEGQEGLNFSFSSSEGKLRVPGTPGIGVGEFPVAMEEFLVAADPSWFWEFCRAPGNCLALCGEAELRGFLGTVTLPVLSCVYFAPCLCLIPCPWKGFSGSFLPMIPCISQTHLSLFSGHCRVISGDPQFIFTSGKRQQRIRA